MEIIPHQNNYGELTGQILEALQTHGALFLPQLVDVVGLPDSRQTRNRVGQILFRLQESGYVFRPFRGCYRLTRPEPLMSQKDYGIRLH